MSWLDWFRNRRNTIDPRSWVDLDKLVAAGVRDLPATRRAIAQLERERKALRRRQRKLAGRPSRQMRREVIRIALDDSASPDLQAYQLSQTMRESGTHNRASELLTQQSAVIDDRIQEINKALSLLRIALLAQENSHGPRQTA